MKQILLLFIVTFVITSAFAEVIIIRQPTNPDPFKEKITGRAIARKEPGNELVFVPIRGCGKIPLFKNSKGELPNEGDRVEFAFGGRCKISDWKKQ